MSTTPRPLTITWDKLPLDYVLPDDPVDNRTQPLLAQALTDALRSNQRLGDRSIIATNYAICATVNGKTVVKAPDWVYVPQLTAPAEAVERSYTPQLQGDFPAIVMEFLAETEGGEYSTKPTYPPGKCFFYEQVLQVPSYVIFDPQTSQLELYQRDRSGHYQISLPHHQERYWLPELNLFLGVWSGEAFGRKGSWLRWWDAEGTLLLWEQEQLAQERQRSAQLLAQLRAAGIEPDGQ
ncbi:MAG: Uma2 family endonuclease [Spirulinaceae cyanobacterium]